MSSQASSTTSSRRSSWRNSLTSIVDLAKEHHVAMNAAYSAHWGVPRPASTLPSPAAGRKQSAASVSSSSSSVAESAEAEKKKAAKTANQSSKWSGAWQDFKQSARANHVAVNDAYASFYGIGTHYSPQSSKGAETRNN